MNLDQLCLYCMREGVSGGVCAYCGKKAGFAQDPPFALPTGSILHGRYLSGRVLGCGGFGITYLALDLHEGRRVAIKEFFPSGLSTRAPGDSAVRISRADWEDYRYGCSQFLKEAQILYTCRSNPNVVSVEKLFEENGTAYYVMEYLQGKDLRRHLQDSGGKIGWQESLRLLKPIFGALELVHSKQIIHRDISPDNIYVCKDGSVRLLDFGAARASLGEKSGSVDVILKRGYAPPEQYLSHGKQGPWTDVYALACTIYHCITGAVPQEATQRLHRDTCQPLATACPGVPSWLSQAVQKGMDVRAQARFQTAQDFYEALYVQQQPNALQEVRGAGKRTVITSAPVPSDPCVGKRLAAYLIDALVAGALTLLLFNILPLYTRGGLLLLGWMVLYLYSTGCECASMAATLGKRLMKVQVTDCGGKRAGTQAVAVRNLIKYAPALLGVYFPPLSLLLLVDGGAVFVTRSRQTLHDLAAKTLVGPPFAYRARVVTVPGPPAPAPCEKAGVQGVSGAFLGSYFPVQESGLVLGRDPQACSIIFAKDARGVSGVHCSLAWDVSSRTVLIKDLGSTYGTLLFDGRKLTSRQTAVLRDGESFTVGEQNTFVVRIGG